MNKIEKAITSVFTSNKYKNKSLMLDLLNRKLIKKDNLISKKKK